MRAAFIETLCELAEQNEHLWLLTGDLGYSVLERFAVRFPKRFVNVGVAEQNMTGIAAGLAMSGKIVFTYSIANFPTLRCLEQIRNDVCYHNANVKIVAVGGGLAYGTQGVTHHGTEDLAIMRTLPNMKVIAPADPAETRIITQEMVKSPGPCYLRLGKASELHVHNNIPDTRIGKAITLRDGHDVTLIAIGDILYNCLKAGEILEKQGIFAKVLSMHTLKPLDEDAILSAVQETKAILTVEEHSAFGGLGSAVAEVLSRLSTRTVAYRSLSIGETFCKVIGGQEYLRQSHGLSITGICEAVQTLLSGPRPAGKGTH